MVALICFVLTVLASPFQSNIRLEAENAVLRHQVIVLRRKLKGRARLTNNDRWFFVQLYRWFPSILPDLMIIRTETLVRWHNAGTLASGRLSPLLVLEIMSTGRATADRGGIARADPADEQGEFALGVRRASTANCSSSGLNWLNQASPSTWSSTEDHQARGGGPFCETTRRTLPPWICSLFRPLASNCCTA